MTQDADVVVGRVAWLASASSEEEAHLSPRSSPPRPSRSRGRGWTPSALRAARRPVPAGAARRLHPSQDARLLEALGVPADKRVSVGCNELTVEYGDNASETVVPLTQDVLAGMAGTTRPTVNQALQALQVVGAVSVQRGRIRVNDPAALQRRAR